MAISGFLAKEADKLRTFSRDGGWKRREPLIVEWRQKEKRGGKTALNEENACSNYPIPDKIVVKKRTHLNRGKSQNKKEIAYTKIETKIKKTSSRHGARKR